jgi:hypothetical protein
MTDPQPYAEGAMYLTVFRDPRNIRRLRAAKVTNKPPTAVNADEVVIRVLVTVPQAAFQPLDGGRVEVTDFEDVAAVEVEGVPV